ncbi:antitermination protein NusB [Fusobacterium necrophorum subsp. funduliforme]|nr:transcription antitermination factor NusB [Fusobacterium necrophorum]AZW10143.1 transcription antitermination factor NusB [Fusobacterium necrophorum subsp. necrophorum]EHO18528.1 transcription antitermination factor NusB [Fusobacterium necrophorum subsp. funduliforme 1_1_36S]AVQ22215.1 transcription antitermination factor NusB [Fusobacterium necrophorum subsp. funduliforme]AYV94085.1 transcription antitermination factor NusB [Fusobacterium necrophorum subsp. funduliforme]AYV96249.1 transcri
MTRREAREELFKWIFQTEIQGNSMEKAFEYSSLREEIEKDEVTKLFLERYRKGLAEHREEIETKIQAAMTDWDFSRIGYVEKSLLKLAVYEMYFEDLPVEIIVNEAVEIAKIYGDVKTHEFINGVLAKVIKMKQ